MGKDKVYILRFGNNEQLDPMSLIPEFIRVEKDVRSDPKFSLRSIASIE